MNFFKKLFGKKQQEPLPVNEDVFPEAGRLLSGGDESVVRQIGYYVEHSEEYLAGQDAHYRSLSNDTTKYDICLFAMIDALIEHDYMREFDWKEDQDDILHGLRVITKKLGVNFDIEMDLSFLDDGEDAECLETERVFTLVAVYISNFRYDLVCIDINSDSYVMGLLPHKDHQRCEAMLHDMDIRLYSF